MRESVANELDPVAPWPARFLDELNTCIDRVAREVDGTEIVLETRPDFERSVRVERRDDKVRCGVKHVCRVVDLVDDSHWNLASDSYLLLVYLHEGNDELLASTFIRLGRCYQYLNCLDESRTMFGSGIQCAIEAGSLSRELLARVGTVRLDILRGQLVRAEQTLQAVLRRAEEHDLAAIRSRALHELSSVAIARQAYADAARFALDALPNCEASQYYRILNDIANAIYFLGHLQLARSLYHLTMRNASERITRSPACINLLNIESMCGNREAFDSWSRLLSREQLPAELTAVFRFEIGLGLVRFGEPEAAADHLARARAMAMEYGFPQLPIYLDELAAGKVTLGATQRIARPLPKDVIDAVSALHSA